MTDAAPKPMKCCAVCRFFDQAKYTLPRGLCKLFDRTVTAKEAACPGFERAEKLSLSVFSYLLNQLPPQTSIKEACELIGIRYEGSDVKKKPNPSGNCRYCWYDDEDREWYCSETGEYCRGPYVGACPAIPPEELPHVIPEDVK